MQKAREIVIVAYRPEWAEEFEAIARPLRETLGETALRIDHIGSTSVPDLSAKNIIDLQVTVRDLTPNLEVLFQQAGYARVLHASQDHIPPTSSDEPPAWTKQLYTPALDTRPCHVHVRRAGSPNGRYALLFRDYLRAHPLAALAYARAKVALAKHGPTDWDLYYDVKDPICDILMAGAEDWAAMTNWRTDYYA